MAKVTGSTSDPEEIKRAKAALEAQRQKEIAAAAQRQRDLAQAATSSVADHLKQDGGTSGLTGKVKDAANDLQKAINHVNQLRRANRVTPQDLEHLLEAQEEYDFLRHGTKKSTPKQRRARVAGASTFGGEPWNKGKSTGSRAKKIWKKLTE